MNSMSDERFLELAMKSIAGETSATERAELESVLDGDPARRGELARLEGQARLAQVVLPLADATKASVPQLPGYARERLRTKVRRTLGASDGASGDRIGTGRGIPLGWRWLLGFLGATAVLAVAFLPGLLAPQGPVIEVAMFDPAGPVRGASTNEITILRETWPSSTVREFSDAEPLREWLAGEPGSLRRPLIRVVYDRTAAEIRLTIRRGGSVTEKTIPVEEYFGSALVAAQEFAEAALRTR